MHNFRFYNVRMIQDNGVCIQIVDLSRFKCVFSGYRAKLHIVDCLRCEPGAIPANAAIPIVPASKGSRVAADS